jgi:pimeloyl-ACP methyl ester carboxylesterase
VILVGHSWGGAVITQAGDDSKVAGLVYVTAYAPPRSGNLLMMPAVRSAGRKDKSRFGSIARSLRL